MCGWRCSRAARGLPLQGRGGKWRKRVAPRSAALDRGDRNPGALAIAAAAAVAFASLSRSKRSSALPSSRVRRAVNLSPASVVNSTSTLQYSRALNASTSASRSQIRRSATDCTRHRRAAARQLAPQHRRQGKADSRTSAWRARIGVHQFNIDISGLGKRFQHRVARHLVEDDAFDLDASARRPFSTLADVPGDRLAFSRRRSR